MAGNFFAHTSPIFQVTDLESGVFGRGRPNYGASTMDVHVRRVARTPIETEPRSIAEFLCRYCEHKGHHPRKTGGVKTLTLDGQPFHSP